MCKTETVCRAEARQAHACIQWMIGSKILNLDIERLNRHVYCVVVIWCHVLQYNSNLVPCALTLTITTIKCFIDNLNNDNEQKVIYKIRGKSMGEE